MRTNIVIDDKLMVDTLKATGLQTKREVVELGLKTLLRLRQQSKIKTLRGKITWDGDLDAMRREKWSWSIQPKNGSWTRPSALFLSFPARRKPQP
jgi:Arc/MetJ family transcription regulator